MQKHLQEKRLDLILDGLLSPDELFQYWLWIKRKTKIATNDWEQYFNLPYMQVIKKTFYEGCVKHPKYHKFYSENLYHIDVSRNKELLLDESENNQSISDELSFFQENWELPQELNELIEQIKNEE